MGLIKKITDTIKKIIIPPKKDGGDTPKPKEPPKNITPPSTPPKIIKPSPTPPFSPVTPAPSAPSSGGGSRRGTPAQYIDPKTGQGFSGIPPSDNVIIEPIRSAKGGGGSNRTPVNQPDNPLNLPIQPDNPLTEVLKRPRPSPVQLPNNTNRVRNLPYQRRGTQYYNPLTKKFEEQTVDFVPQLSEEGGFTFQKASELIPTGVYNVGRKIFPEKKVATNVNYDPSFRYNVGGTSQYNPVTKQFEAPSGQIQVETFTSSLPKVAATGTYLGQYFIPVYGATLFAGQTAEGGKTLYTGIKTKDTSKIIEGSLQVAPALVFGGIALKRFITKPRIKILEPATRTEPVSQEIQWLNPQTGKIEAIKAEGYMALPPKVRIENLFFTKYEGYIGKPKTYIEFTPRATELGKPVITFQQKVGSKYGDFFLSQSEGTQGVSVKLGRGYLNKPNEVFIFKNGKTTSTFRFATGTTEAKAVDNLLVTQFKGYSQDISLPSSFQKATGLSGRKKLIQESRGTIIRILPTEESSSIFTKGVGTKSSANYFQELYQQQGASQLIFPTKIKKPSYNRNQILKKVGIEETPESLSAFSQYKYGWGYAQSGGTYKEDIREIETNIQSFGFNLKNLETKETSISKNIELVSDVSKDKTAEGLSFGNIEVFKEDTKTNQGSRSGSRERIIEKVKDIITESPIQQERIIQRERLFTTTILTPRPFKPIRPVRTSYKTYSDLGKTKLFDKITKAYDVIVFNRGKEQIVAKGLPIGLARKAGVREVLSNLRASFKLRERGTTLVEDVDYDLPFTFAPSKREKGRFVQKLTTRFGTKGETKQAQFFRKQKSRRIKWF